MRISKQIQKDMKTLMEMKTAAATVQEDKPIAYAAKNFMSGKWEYIWHEKDDVQGWINLQHQSRDDVTYIGPVPLYASPQPSSQEEEKP